MPFICFSDDPALVSDTWEIRPLAPLFGMDHIRNQREYKIRAHHYLPDFDQSLYIDNSVLLSVAPEQIFDGADLATGLCLPPHSYRESLLDEFLAVVRDNLDDPGRIFEQLNHYSIDMPDVLTLKPFWSAIMLRDHRDPVVAVVMETWIAHVHRYSRRDQLSSLIAFRQAGVQPGVLPVDNYESWMHRWPHARERRTDRRIWQAGTVLAPPGARIRDMELEVLGLRRRVREVEQLLAERAAAQHAAIEALKQEHAQAMAAESLRWQTLLAETDTLRAADATNAAEDVALAQAVAEAQAADRVARQAAELGSRQDAALAAQRTTFEQELAERFGQHMAALDDRSRQMAQALADQAARHDRAMEGQRLGLERALGRLHQEHAAILSSRTWRMMAPVRAIGRRLAGLHRGIRSAGRRPG